jgi:hypothetical protein
LKEIGNFTQRAVNPVVVLPGQHSYNVAWPYICHIAPHAWLFVGRKMYKERKRNLLNFEDKVNSLNFRNY